MALSSGFDYEVFLSFRGPDTRAGITDFLYVSLIDAGIRAYRDDEELRFGEEMGAELLGAIHQSKISIPIFSLGYASSKWCLEELAQMVECRKTRGQKIMPIFYDVAPSEVRHQTGGYGEAFLSHESNKRYDDQTIDRWKAALNEVGSLKGWDLQSKPKRYEGEFTRGVVKEVFRELKKSSLGVSDYLVPIDNHVDEIIELIGTYSPETRIIGIHGLGGVGKTTLAKISYNQLSRDFKDCCFLSNIRETSKLHGIEHVQNQLLSDIIRGICPNIRNVHEGMTIIKDRLSCKRVLLLLDDVDERNHIDALVGNRDWFGEGSKLIITTRNKDVLNIPKVDCTYELNGMDPDQSLQLFSKHAFRRDKPLDEYVDQSKKAIDIAKGLPLALEVIGSLLSRCKKEMWDVTLKKLESVPPAEVQSKLRISYDTLDVRQRHIFLDIACLFIGHHRDIMLYFWDESDFFPEDALEVLENMSLIKIQKDNKVWMHDQLRDLGREMVRQESNMKVEKQSRVWNREQALGLLTRNEEKEKVEALCLKLNHLRPRLFTRKDFMRLPNLKFLEVEGASPMGEVVENVFAQARLLWHDFSSNVLPTAVFREKSILLPKLRWLSLNNLLPKLDIGSFPLANLSVLDVSQSGITHIWRGWSQMKMAKNLKVLNLTGCHYLKEIPNLSAFANLERLVLKKCRNLAKINESIGQLKRLVSLDVRYCRELRRLPDELGELEALKELLLDSTPIMGIPEIRGMKDLRIISACHCNKIAHLPLSIGVLASLEYLSLRGCMSLERLPDSIGKLESLIALDISCTGIKELPDSLWTMEKLEAIRGEINRHLRVEIRNDTYRSSSLRILKLTCAQIHAVPKLPKSLISIELSELHMKTLPDLSDLINLRELNVCFCVGAQPAKLVVNPPDLVWTIEKLEAIRVLRLPKSLISLQLSELHMEMLPDLSDLINLRELNVRFFLGARPRKLVEDPMPWWIGRLSKLESLMLSSEVVVTFSAGIGLLSRLETLNLRCPNLRYLPRLPASLSSLHLHYCMSIHAIDLSNLKKLSELTLESCAITKIQGLDRLENLQALSLNLLGRLEVLPDLSNSKKLRKLSIERCERLVEIQGEMPASLEWLSLERCRSLEKVPDLTILEGLHMPNVYGCSKLNVEAIPDIAEKREETREGNRRRRVRQPLWHRHQRP